MTTNAFEGSGSTTPPDRGTVDLGIRCNTLIAGSTGSGKTVTLNTMIAGLAAIGPALPGNRDEDGSKYRGSHCAVVGVDLKGGTELSRWFPRMSFLATSLNEVDFLLDRLLEESDRRSRRMKLKGVEQLRATRKHPLVFCVIDELASVVLSGETGLEHDKAREAAEGSGSEFDEYAHPRSDASRMVKIRRLATTGMDNGIFLIVATQVASPKILYKELLEGFDQRLCHRVHEAYQAELVLGVGGASTVAPAHLISPCLPGVMYAKTAFNDAPVQCTNHFYSDAEISRIACDTSHKRCDLKFLEMPGYLHRGSVMEEMAEKSASIPQDPAVEG